MRESRYNIWVDRGDYAYVFNGISGSLLRIRSGERDDLQQFLAGRRALCSTAVLERMLAGDMIVSDDFDEVELLARRYRSSRNDQSRFSLTLVTSLGCNFDCPYCFEAKHPSLMSEETQDCILALLDAQITSGISSFYVTWFGGEPLLGKKSLLRLSDKFVERCGAAGVNYDASIVTNGYLLDEATCRQLRDRRVTSVQVTLDGPPEFHDVMRPLAGGGPTFERILANVKLAVKYFQVVLRVNLSKDNVGGVPALLSILRKEGLCGQVTVVPGQIVSVDDGAAAPSASCGSGCLSLPAFAEVELEFVRMARNLGFATNTLPVPTSAPCTAVRANELVVGSKGELYKCWESVGNQSEIIGHIQEIGSMNSRLAKWLKYDPFTNEECVSCVALPVCMGGCAHHAFVPEQYENRCGTFRHRHLEQVASFVDFAEEGAAEVPVDFAGDGPGGAAVPVGVRKPRPVDLGLPSYRGDTAALGGTGG